MAATTGLLPVDPGRASPATPCRPQHPRASSTSPGCLAGIEPVTTRATISRATTTPKAPLRAPKGPVRVAGIEPARSCSQGTCCALQLDSDSVPGCPARVLREEPGRGAEPGIGIEIHPCRAGRSGGNRTHVFPVPETGALPLGDAPVRRLGIEPSCPAFQTGAMTTLALSSCTTPVTIRPAGVKSPLPRQENCGALRTPSRYRAVPAEREKLVTSLEVDGGIGRFGAATAGPSSFRRCDLRRRQTIAGGHQDSLVAVLGLTAIRLSRLGDSNPAARITKA